MDDLQKRREFIKFMDRVSAFWRSTFENSRSYSSSQYWNLFIMLWRNNNPVKLNEAFTFMPELKSISGSKNYIDRAIEDRYIEIVPGEASDEKSSYIRLTSALRGELDRCFLDCADELLKASERMRSE